MNLYAPVKSNLSEPSFLRLCQIIGTDAAKQRSRSKEKKTEPVDKTIYEPLIPVSRTAWYTGIKDGRYPKPVRLSHKCSVWRSDDILAVLTGPEKEVEMNG